MKIDTSALVTLTEANQDFSKVAQLVDERGIESQALDKKLFENMVDAFIKENQEALQELAKY